MTVSYRVLAAAGIVQLFLLDYWIGGARQACQTCH